MPDMIEYFGWRDLIFLLIGFAAGWIAGYEPRKKS